MLTVLIEREIERKVLMRKKINIKYEKSKDKIRLKIIKTNDCSCHYYSLGYQTSLKRKKKNKSENGFSLSNDV